MRLTVNYFESVGQVAKHCNFEKMKIAIDEAWQFDLLPLICPYENDFITHWFEGMAGDFNSDFNQDFSITPIPFSSPLWEDILEGSSFTNCSGDIKSQVGARKILAYFAYSRYVVINEFDDTPNGAVTKKNDFSIPKDEKTIRNYSDRYQNMAMVLFKDFESFLCLNGFTRLKGCAGCGCNGSCGKSYPRTRGWGLNSENISK